MNYYDEIANSYVELHHQEQLLKHQAIKKLNIMDDKDSILDIAHGVGIINEIFPNNYILGLDNSQKLLSLSNCKTLYYDFNNLPLPLANKSFEHCFCISAIHHHNNPKELAKETKRIAKKSIIISLLKKSSSYLITRESLLLLIGKCSIEVDGNQDDILVWNL
jgi:ubiquinone/menaquinone biosynthesis C-methylase UbiE